MLHSSAELDLVRRDLSGLLGRVRAPHMDMSRGLEWPTNQKAFENTA
jgi:hypothetical protein